MKKFSKLTNQKINAEPKVEQKVDESTLFRSEVIYLIERLLRVQSHGAVDNRFLSGSISIEGKEMLAEAIVDLLQDKTKKEQTKILENLKSEITDWDTIDKNIDIINKKSPTLNNKLKFTGILERYDDETLVVYLESIYTKLSSESIEDYKILVTESTIKDEYKSKMMELLNS